MKKYSWKGTNSKLFKRRREEGNTIKAEDDYRGYIGCSVSLSSRAKEYYYGVKEVGGNYVK